MRTQKFAASAGAAIYSFVSFQEKCTEQSDKARAEQEKKFPFPTGESQAIRPVAVGVRLTKPRRRRRPMKKKKQQHRNTILMAILCYRFLHKNEDGNMFA